MIGKQIIVDCKTGKRETIDAEFPDSPPYVTPKSETQLLREELKSLGVAML